MADGVIAIDGPAASGKSSTAKAVAARLNLAHLDSGALYRAATLAALDTDIPLTGIRVVALARSLPVGLRLTDAGYRPSVAGVDVSTEIRTERVTARVSEVAALPEVRGWVNEALRVAVAEHPRGVVMDGRDIGTVVFPDAALKIFLIADPEERARRRLLQDGRATEPDSIDAASRQLIARDAADSARSVAPLAQAADAVVVDTTGLSFDEQVDQVTRLARKAFG